MSVFGVIRRLFPYVWKYRWQCFFGFLSLPLVSLATVSFTALIGPIFNDVLGASPQGLSNPLAEWIEKLSLDRLFPLTEISFSYWVIGLFIAVFALHGVFEFMSDYLIRAVGLRIVMDLRFSLFEKIVEQPVDFFHKNTVGELVSRVLADVERIRELVSERFATMTTDTLNIFALSGLVFYINWRLTLASFVALPLLVIPIYSFGKSLRKISRRSLEQIGGVSNVLKESTSAPRIVKIFCAETYEVGRFKEAIGKLFRTEQKALYIYAVTSPIIGVLGALLLGAILVYAHTEIKTGEMTTGTFAVFAGGLFGMYMPIKRLSKANVYIQRAIAAAQRTFEVADTRTETETLSGDIELSAIKEGIEFRDVSFLYPNAPEPTLKNISFKAKLDEVVALVGASGAGKTTLVNLLPRFFDVSSGKILIDGTDIKEFTLKSLRGNIGMVTQDIVLFNNTIRANIAFGKRDATENEILNAGKLAFVDPITKRLSGGYDYVIGEVGDLVSGGERQRISIARAILKNPPILILDEATSALDAESEMFVQKALSNLIKGRLTFVIAHRLSTVLRADRILVLHNGAVVGEGRHEDLIRENRYYASLYHNESFGVEKKDAPSQTG